nr:HAMP domain-containing sensor histidine kinase [Marinobacter sp. DS40M8]
MRRTEQALKETNIYLEQRVKERTQELQVINEQMLKAKSVAEQANQSKTRFLASASHDLLQPLNAARLFTSALAGKARDPEMTELVDHIDSSLGAAEEIISTLLDISKLDAGALEPDIGVFPVNEIMRHLATDFSAIAKDQGLDLHVVPSSAWVRSDSKLLRRVIQNFLSNAIRYTPSGKILLGCRRLKGISALRYGIPGRVFRKTSLLTSSRNSVVFSRAGTKKALVWGSRLSTASAAC